MQQSSTRSDLWLFRDDALADVADLIGFSVEGRDGEELGTVHEAAHTTGASYLVVLTGIWFFSSRVVLPAGVVDRIDLDAKTVYVDLTRAEIEKAPEFDEARYREPSYRDKLADHYRAGRRR